VDTNWAYTRENVGPTLFHDFGFQGVFVVNDLDRTVYALVEGKLQPIELTEWLDQPVAALLEQARAGAATDTPVTTFINVRGNPTLVAAAAITPGTDPSVIADDRKASVLLFINILDSAKLTEIGNDFGVDHLHIATPDEIGKTLLFALGENGAAGSLHWHPERPGMRLMAVGLPLLGLAALLVCLMTWLIVRRTTADAQALDNSHTSLQDSQNALATSEARFRDVVEASSDWVWEIDGEWRFTYLSERFESVTGLDRQAWIGATLYDLLDTDAGALSQWLTTPAARGYQPAVSLRRRPGTGAHHPAVGARDALRRVSRHGHRRHRRSRGASPHRVPVPARRPHRAAQSHAPASVSGR